MQQCKLVYKRMAGCISGRKNKLRLHVRWLKLLLIFVKKAWDFSFTLFPNSLIYFFSDKNSFINLHFKRWCWVPKEDQAEYLHLKGQIKAVHFSKRTIVSKIQMFYNIYKPFDIDREVGGIGKKIGRLWIVARAAFLFW